MRGYLKSLILKMINDEPMSGSEIISRMEKFMNWKPSCGSIYPLLNNLEKEDLTISKQIKGKKIYTLTINGKKFLRKKDKEKEELIKVLEKSYKLLESIYDIDTKLEIEMLEDIKKGTIPFQEIFEETKLIKDELSRLQKTNKLSKNLEKIKKILKHAGNELKKI